MIEAPIPEGDADRIASLNKMNLLSTAREIDIDRITRTAQKVFNAEIALVSLVDKDRQWFKSRCGLDATETPRNISFCAHAIQSDETFIVNDAAADKRFYDNPLVTGAPHVRFYAGQPLKNGEGYRIGTLCVISSRARGISGAEMEVLQDLGRMVEVVLENRKLNETQSALLDSLVLVDREKLIDPLTGVWNRRGIDELFEREVARAVRENTTLAVAMIDLDNFKKINDTFGHPTGDEAIKLTATLLLEAARATDVVGRYGGEEFAVIAPGVASAMLPILANKIMRVFRAKAAISTSNGLHPFSVSMGLAIARPKKGERISRSLFELADKALYAAKAGGKNRFEISGISQNFYSDFALA